MPDFPTVDVARPENVRAILAHQAWEAELEQRFGDPRRQGELEAFWYRLEILKYNGQNDLARIERFEYLVSATEGVLFSMYGAGSLRVSRVPSSRPAVTLRYNPPSYAIPPGGIRPPTPRDGVAPATNAASQINPRLTQRLEAFRAYKANDGLMDMAQWVRHTKANPNWGTGPNSGYADWIRSVESVHGNSSLSSRTAYLYRLEDADGNLLKWGVTQDLKTRYPQMYMLNKQIKLVTSGRRSDILRLERELIETQPGSLNFESWAGRRLGE